MKCPGRGTEASTRQVSGKAGVSGSREGWDSLGQQEPGAENFSRDSCPVVLSSAFRQEYGQAEDELDCHRGNPLSRNFTFRKPQR